MFLFPTTYQKNFIARTSVNDILKELVHDLGESLGVQHSMQGSNKDSLLGVQPDGGAFDVVALVDHPRDHLHLLGLHAARRNLVVPVSRAQHILGAALHFCSSILTCCSSSKMMYMRSLWFWSVISLCLATSPSLDQTAQIRNVSV
jgi:hypothetical protein